MIILNNYELLANRTSKRKRIYAHTERICNSFNSEDVLSPISIEVFPTNRCNSRCHFCVYPKVDYDELSPVVFQELISSCIDMGVKSVTFSGGGEPTLHKFLPSAIEQLADAGICVGLITNGVYFSEELRAVLHRCSWIRFSLLTADADEYCKFTSLGKNQYERVLENIRSVTAHKENVITGSTIMLCNNEFHFSSIVSYLNLAHELRLDQVFFTEMVGGIGQFKMDKKHIIQYADGIRQLAQNLQIVTNISKFISKADVSTVREKTVPCHIIERNLINVITADGNVYPCLGQYTIEHASPLGSLCHQKFEEILTKRNIDKMICQYLQKDCKYCKNSTTRNELMYFLETGHVGNVSDPHNMFI